MIKVCQKQDFFAMQSSCFKVQVLLCITDNTTAISSSITSVNIIYWNISYISRMICSILNSVIWITTFLVLLAMDLGSCLFVSKLFIFLWRKCLCNRIWHLFSLLCLDGPLIRAWWNFEGDSEPTSTSICIRMCRNLTFGSRISADVIRNTRNSPKMPLIFISY